MKVELLTRSGCHLCEEARALLESYGLVVEPIDIDEHPDLREQYCDCIPVVRIDGVVRFRGRVNEVLLQRLLRRTDATGLSPAGKAGVRPDRRE